MELPALACPSLLLTKLSSTVTYALCFPLPARSPSPPYSHPRSRRQSNAASAHLRCVSLAATMSSSAPSAVNASLWWGHRTTMFLMQIMACLLSSGWPACAFIPSSTTRLAPASIITSTFSGIRSAIDARAVKPARMTFALLSCTCIVCSISPKASPWHSLFLASSFSARLLNSSMHRDARPGCFMCARRALMAWSKPPSLRIALTMSSCTAHPLRPPQSSCNTSGSSSCLFIAA
mmetsp:Transcript_24817/g.62660  ORF Transcript_24817/g.62660 Transcript_24817/m.62660 type:complete len:235 (+) Transcript_24817:149-853(+)